MLSRLYIKNYVLIEELEVFFQGGFQVITGETGAGKSIIVDALSLALGARFDRHAILHAGTKCVIELDFVISLKSQVSTWLKQHDFDMSSKLAVRREISLPYRTRSFINDTPAKLSQVQELAVYLVDFHRQFDNMNIFRPLFELDMLDSYGQSDALLEKYRLVYKELRAAQRQLNKLTDDLDTFTQKREYDQHMLQELEGANLVEADELARLEIKIKEFEHSDRIRNILTEVVYLLEEGESSLMEQGSRLDDYLRQLRDLYPSIHGLADRMHSVFVEWKDIAASLKKIKQHDMVDQEEFECVRDRYSLLCSLLRKHQKQQIEELVHLRDDLKIKLEDQLNAHQLVEDLKKVITRCSQGLMDIAGQLTKKRMQSASLFQENIHPLLGEMGMPNSLLKIQVTPLEEFSLQGKDDVSFLMDANGVGVFQPVSQIASGGELARMMLCLKIIVGDHMQFPVMIFDEVDTGVSGDVAAKIGLQLHKLAQGRQIICVTHQPPIAAHADDHYKVMKQKSDDNVMRTTMKVLLEEECVKELALMMGDEGLSASSIQYAKEMLAQKHKKNC